MTGAGEGVVHHQSSPRFLELHLRRVGELLRERQNLIRQIQWLLVLIYLFLLTVPALPALFPSLLKDGDGGGVIGQVTVLARVLFWCVWWPGVILSVMVFGQFWCGLLCPDGAVTEFASRHGRAFKIPRELRWAGWPLLLFTLITLLEAVLDIRSKPLNTLLVLGSLSLGALMIGLLLGKGKRVWCRYLCPTAGVFSLLARCAVVHFRVDRAAWDAAPRPGVAVDCPLMLDVRRLRSNEKCSMCGRCCGHRDAVSLSCRSPGAEIATMKDGEGRPVDVFVILWVLLGLAPVLARGEHHSPARLLGLAGAASAPILDLILAPTLAAIVYAICLFWGARWRMDKALRIAYTLIPFGGLQLVLLAAALGVTAINARAMEGIRHVGLAIPLLVAGFSWSWYLAGQARLSVRPRASLALVLTLATALSLL